MKDEQPRKRQIKERRRYVRNPQGSSRDIVTFERRRYIREEFLDVFDYRKCSIDVTQGKGSSENVSQSGILFENRGFFTVTRGAAPAP